MGKVLVISAFPGMGKSYFTREHSNYSKQILDSDSSLFKWEYNNDGTRSVNSSWSNNYLNYIKYFSKEFKNYPAMDLIKNPLNNSYNISGVILTSTHKEVLEGLSRKEIKNSVLFPTSINDILPRLEKRNDSKEFIDMITDNFDKFINQIKEGKYPLSKKVAISGTLTSELSNIIDLK